MPGRLLRLLSLLQSRGWWQAGELSERLGVQPRTLRRDIERLKSLDYPVRSRTGRDGGYDLGESSNLPPLQFDDEEAVAIAVSLSTASRQVRGQSVSDGVRVATDSARIKLERMLPARLRHRYHRLVQSIEAGPGPDVEGATMLPDTDVLLELSDACADHQALSFIHVKRDGARTLRHVRPHKLVTMSGYWYLVAFDSDRRDWRSFRVERISSVKYRHERFEPQVLDAFSFVARSFAEAHYRFNATVTFEISALQLRSKYHGTIFGVVKELTCQRCEVSLSADSLDLIVEYLCALLSVDADFDIAADHEVLNRLQTIRARLGTVG